VKSFKDISEKLKKDKDDPCWKGYVQVGMKKKDGKEVPNCVPKEGVDEKKDTHKTKDGRTAKKGLWYNINQKKKRGEAPAKKGDPDYPKTLNIESIEEKAVSKAQQKFMGMVRAKQKGEMDDASPEVSKAAASMSKKDVKDFAKTKHKGLPAKKESVEEAKVSVGDRVTLQPNKSVLDRNLIGKAGVVTNMLDGDAMVKFASGRTIAVSPRHLKINESVELDEASGKDIAAKMMKSKSMKAFAAKVARMPNVSAGDLEKMLPDYVPGAEIRGLFKEVTEGPDYLGDIRRKKEREDRRKAAGHDKETQRQKTMRKVYGNSMVFLKKGYGESVDLGEGRSDALKAFESLVKRGGIDRATFQKAYDLYKATKFNELKKLIRDADTDVSEAIAELIQRHDSKAFNSMYPKAKSGDYLRNIVKEEVELDEAMGPIDKDQLARLKKAYAGIDKMNVSGPAYKKVKKWIASLDKEDLTTLAKAKVKWLSQFAASELRLTHNVKVSPKEYMESMNFFEFRQALNEAQLYHNSFSAAVQHAMKQVQKKGYEIDEDDWQRKVASGPSKPSAGKTNRYTVDLMKNGKPVKQKLQMQVYGMDSGKYELNMYVS
jgi:hypothetical protein